MAEVRLRHGSLAGSLWMTTPYALLRCASSKRRLEVCAVFRAGRSDGVSSGRFLRAPLRRRSRLRTIKSFIYHPDKNAGSEHAASRFSQISEAYSVLGNKTLRKKYDSGFLSEADVRGSSRPAATQDVTSGSSSHVQRNRRSPEVAARSQTVFDFDTFYREHYGEQLQRQKHIRARLQEIKRQKEEAFQDRKLGLASEIAVGVMLAVAAAILFGMKATKG